MATKKKTRLPVRANQTWRDRDPRHASGEGVKRELRIKAVVKKTLRGRPGMYAVCERVEGTGRNDSKKEAIIHVDNFHYDFDLVADQAEPAPDANCITTPDGGCIGGPCMHDAKETGT